MADFAHPLLEQSRAAIWRSGSTMAWGDQRCANCNGRRSGSVARGSKELGLGGNGSKGETEKERELITGGPVTKSFFHISFNNVLTDRWTE